MNTMIDDSITMHAHSAHEHAHAQIKKTPIFNGYINFSADFVQRQDPTVPCDPHGLYGSDRHSIIYYIDLHRTFYYAYTSEMKYTGLIWIYTRHNSTCW